MNNKGVGSIAMFLILAICSTGIFIAGSHKASKIRDINRDKNVDQEITGNGGNFSNGYMK